MGAAMKTIGVIGAGQLGLMLAEEAHKLGARVVTLDPAADAPAARVADGHIVAAYDDGAALEELCRRSDVVTYEFENVPGEVLIPLVERYNIPQGFQPLYDSQDRLREKRNAVAHGLRTPRFAPADDRPPRGRPLRATGGRSKRPSARRAASPASSRPARWATTATGRSCCVRRRIWRRSNPISAGRVSSRSS